ncbi:MAG TPA: YciI family protein [Opitutaceae bacterium]|nr:YciI family protein [Opitutaceae bacterium]
MKYALLVHQAPENFDRAKQVALSAAGRAYGEALMAAGVFVGGTGLEAPQSATTVSVRDGKRQVHDGPYAESKEYLAGFAIIDVPNLDVALEWAARHPAAAEVAVEVRPLAGFYFPSRPAKPPGQ